MSNYSILLVGGFVGKVVFVVQSVNFVSAYVNSQAQAFVVCHVGSVSRHGNFRGLDVLDVCNL